MPAGFRQVLGAFAKGAFCYTFGRMYNFRALSELIRFGLDQTYKTVLATFRFLVSLEADHHDGVHSVTCLPNCQMTIEATRSCFFLLSHGSGRLPPGVAELLREWDERVDGEPSDMACLLGFFIEKPDFDAWPLKSFERGSALLLNFRKDGREPNIVVKQSVA